MPLSLWNKTKVDDEESGSPDSTAAGPTTISGGMDTLSGPQTQSSLSGKEAFYIFTHDPARSMRFKSEEDWTKFESKFGLSQDQVTRLDELALKRQVCQAALPREAEKADQCHSRWRSRVHQKLRAVPSHTPLSTGANQIQLLTRLRLAALGRLPVLSRLGMMDIPARTTSWLRCGFGQLVSGYSILSEREWMVSVVMHVVQAIEVMSCTAKTVLFSRKLGVHGLATAHM